MKQDFDHKIDPKETVNLATFKRYGPLVDSLSQELKLFKTTSLIDPVIDS